MSFRDAWSIRNGFVRDDGQTMAEYAVALSVISAIAILAFTGLAGAITNAVNNATSFLP